MRLSTVTTFAVLSMQFFLPAQAGGRLAGKELVAEEEEPSVAAGARKTPDPSHEGSQGTEVRRHPSARLRKAVGEVGAGTHSKAVNKPQLGTTKQMAGSKRQTPPLSSPKSKNQGLQHHLRGHGKFNTDTYACHVIQLKACKKPSDCNGCLGLYTCKLPRGKCDLKAVSRKTGSFSQSIQKR